MGACETEYYEDQAKPVAREFLPAAFAAVRNAAGQPLLVRRADDGLWSYPVAGWKPGNPRRRPWFAHSRGDRGRGAHHRCGWSLQRPGTPAGLP